MQLPVGTPELEREDMIRNHAMKIEVSIPLEPKCVWKLWGCQSSCQPKNQPPPPLHSLPHMSKHTCMTHVHVCACAHTHTQRHGPQQPCVYNVIRASLRLTSSLLPWSSAFHHTHEAAAVPKSRNTEPPVFLSNIMFKVLHLWQYTLKINELSYGPRNKNSPLQIVTCQGGMLRRLDSGISLNAGGLQLIS
jgi:hypothetical protein